MTTIILGPHFGEAKLLQIAKAAEALVGDAVRRTNADSVTTPPDIRV